MIMKRTSSFESIFFNDGFSIEVHGMSIFLSSVLHMCVCFYKVCNYAICKVPRSNRVKKKLENPEYNAYQNILFLLRAML